MEFLPGLAITGSALSAQKLRLDIIANNIANIGTTRTEEGGPYRKKMPVFEERLRETMETGNGFNGMGVKVSAIIEDDSPPIMEYNPEHPDANAEGFVAMPNVNIVAEMVDMISATRSYQANVTALETAKAMALKALEIGRG